jgi:hypothetical protein
MPWKDQTGLAVGWGCRPSTADTLNLLGRGAESFILKAAVQLPQEFKGPVVIIWLVSRIAFIR